MSAIFGVLNMQQRPIERSHLALMDEALRAYGPDGAQLWHDGAVGLGQCLLQTTPAAHLEGQPQMGPGQTCVLVADARLDNRVELGAHFGIAPAALSNIPDSALILMAYEKWGEACPEHLLGDFAFALWDHRTRTLFAARDPLGVKPFYYCHIPGWLVVLASQMAGLLSHPLVPRRLNDLMLAYHMVMHKADPEITFFADCWRLPPAHTLRVRKGELHLHRYWAPDPAREIRLESDAEYVEACRALLRQAVGDRLPIDARVGAHLTGGLDSSTVICLAASRLQESAQSLAGFSWTTLPQPTDDPEEGELPFIADVCAQTSITRYAPQITPEAMRDVILLRSGPGGVMPLPASEMAMHELMHEQGTHVVLSGWGGDEVASFNGRGYWAALAQQGYWRHLGRELLWRHRRSGGHLLGLVLGKVLEPSLPDRFWWPYHQRFGRTIMHDPLRQSYLQSALAQRLRLEERLRQGTPRERPGVRANQLQLLLDGHLAARMEAWSADAARWGLDYRYPLLDRRLIEFCLALPPEQYVRQGWTRYLFRRAIEGIVPERLPWQRDKRDPVSERHGAARRQELWPLLREPLACYAEEPTVSAYVDVPRLQRRLEALCAAAPPGGVSTPGQAGLSTALTAAAFVLRYGPSPVSPAYTLRRAG